VAVPVFIRGADEEGRAFLDLATAVNISAGGALVAIRRYGLVNSEISLEMPAAPRPDVEVTPPPGRKVPAAIIRTTATKRGELWGIEFLQPLGEPSARRLGKATSTE